MQKYFEELEKQIDFLMTAAIQKCGNIPEAEELTQETLLGALTALSQGKKIENLQGWLITVMNRRFYDSLRKKYRKPFISIGSDLDISVEDDLLERISASEEAESVRREVAYLGKSYREVIVRHYMDGESVTDIAAALALPEGTVKHRLYTGRNQIKKGLNQMESYTRPSYQPVTLMVHNSGLCGINGEPATLAYNDLIAQNLLWIAYEKPVTMDELSRAIGIPAAYVEPVVERLTGGELMKCVGNRYYTDFMISTVEERERHIPAQKKFVQDRFPLIWRSLEEGLGKVREWDFCQKATFDQKNSLEMFFAMYCLEQGYFRTFDSLHSAEQVFPPRPDGGRWIAFGSVFFHDYDPACHRELISCRYSGPRQVRLDQYGEAKQVMLQVYGLDGFPAPAYHHCFDGIPLLSRSEGADTRILKLLYLVHSGLRPSRMGFDAEALKAIPMLVKHRILRREGSRPVVNIPVMCPRELGQFQDLCQETIQAMCRDIREPLAAFCLGKKQPLPLHLDSVPLQKQYLWAMNALLLTTIREAIKNGKLHDGDYDNANGENPPPCPMLMIIDA